MIDSYLFNLNSMQPKTGSNFHIPNVEKSITLDHPLGHVSTFHFEVTKDELIFHVQIIEPKMAIPQLKEPHPEWYFHDHFVPHFSQIYINTSQLLILLFSGLL